MQWWDAVASWFVGLGEGINAAMLWVLDLVQSVDPLVRLLLAGLGIMLETSLLVGLIFPGDTVVLVAASGVGSIPEGIGLVVVVVVGALIGESIGYLLGRLLGPWLRFSWLGRKIGERNWARAEAYLLRRGGPAILISRFLPVLHSLVPVTVGMTRFPYRRFLAWTVPACLLWSVIYVTVGATAAGGFRELASRQAHYAGYVFVGIILLFLLLVMLGKKLLTHSERRHLALDEDPDAAADPDPHPASAESAKLADPARPDPTP